VLQLIGREFNNEQIAATLHVSLPTVKTHINKLYSKLGLGSRAEARLRGQALSAA
jgi:ATP/maltotriose-dependent transcriptional regulator MalT